MTNIFPFCHCTYKEGMTEMQNDKTILPFNLCTCKKQKKEVITERHGMTKTISFLISVHVKKG